MLNAQIIDQTLKAVVSGVAGWICNRAGIDAGYSAAITVAIYHVLAQVSTRVGLKGVANFFAKGYPK